MKNKLLPKRILIPHQDQLLQYIEIVKSQSKQQWNSLLNYCNRYWLRITLIAFLSLIILKKDISIQLNLQNKEVIANTTIPPDAPQEQLSLFSSFTKNPTTNSIKKESPKRKQQLSYVKRFAKVAQAEMKKFGIPASITLAQGILETNAGSSPLATKNNNHFGIKCFSRSCKKGHCANFSDDTHKDFFRIYKTAWESFRAHSKLLQNKRYQGLYSLPKKDYKAWASGLKSAGYATDKRYPEKLINLIENLELYQYDS